MFDSWLFFLSPPCHENNVEGGELVKNIPQFAGDDLAVLHHYPGQVAGQHQRLAQSGQLGLLLVSGEGRGDDEHLHLLLLHLLLLLPRLGRSAGLQVDWDTLGYRFLSLILNNICNIYNIWKISYLIWKTEEIQRYKSNPGYKEEVEEGESLARVRLDWREFHHITPTTHQLPTLPLAPVGMS